MRASPFLPVLALATIGASAGDAGATTFLPRSKVRPPSKKSEDNYLLTLPVLRGGAGAGPRSKVRPPSKKSEDNNLLTGPVLRGGAGPFKGKDVAKFATVVSILNAAMIALAPAKTLEMYGLDKTPLTEYMTEWIGQLSVSQAITQWSLYFNGNSVYTAMGAGTLYLVVFSIKSLLNEMPKQFGFSAFGQYLFLAINAICGHALLYNTSYAETVAKVYPIWGLINALSFCLAPEMMSKKWGIEDDALVTYEMKQTGYVLATKAVYLMSLGLGVEPTKALGYCNVPALLGMLMTNFVSKEIQTFGMDPNAQWVWLILKIFYIVSLAF